MSTNPNTLSLKYLESSVIIISFLFIIINISIVYIIIDFFNVSVVIYLVPIVYLLLLFKIISKCWILIIGNCFKLTIRIETEYHTKTIVNETEDWISINEFFHWRVSWNIISILYGSQEINSKINSKENADKDVNHYDLVTDLMLNDIKNEEEENTKYSLSQELISCHKI